MNMHMYEYKRNSFKNHSTGFFLSLRNQVFSKWVLISVCCFFKGPLQCWPQEIWQSEEWWKWRAESEEEEKKEMMGNKETEFLGKELSIWDFYSFYPKNLGCFLLVSECIKLSILQCRCYEGDVCSLSPVWVKDGLSICWLAEILLFCTEGDNVC